MKKYICKQHSLITSRKGLRKHLSKEHCRNDFASYENKTWTREEIKE